MNYVHGNLIKKTLAVLGIIIVSFLIIIIIYYIIEWEIFAYHDCLKVGHAKLYCIGKIIR